MTGRGHRPASAGEGGGSPGRPAILDYSDDAATGVIAIWAWFALAFALAWIVGFEVGLALFVLIYARLNGVAWLTSGLVAFIQWAVIHGVFGVVMDIPWPEPLMLRLF